MNNCEWIVCESTSRWASALRMALERDSRFRDGTVRLYETRQLTELTQRLAERPHCFAAVEVRVNNVGDVLGWFPWAASRFGHVRCVAFVERSLVSGQTDVVDALREAGALAVTSSPRQLRTIVDLFWRHAALSAKTANSLAAQLPWREQVWQSLPWQAARPRVG